MFVHCCADGVEWVNSTWWAVCARIHGWDGVGEQLQQVTFDSLLWLSAQFRLMGAKCDLILRNYIQLRSLSLYADRYSCNTSVKGRIWIRTGATHSMVAAMDPKKLESRSWSVSLSEPASKQRRGQSRTMSPCAEKSKCLDSH